MLLDKHFRELGAGILTGKFPARILHQNFVIVGTSRQIKSPSKILCRAL
jgi:hypothetical protein